MLDTTKTDARLGFKVNNYLKKKGVQTPMTNNVLTDKDKVSDIKQLFESIMKSMGLDLKDDSLNETPKRVAKMFVNELFWGLNFNNFPKITTVENKIKYNEMVIEKNIKINSACEHHFVTIWGKCHIGYIPNKKVLGLSKLNRITKYFCRRPQIQERIGQQIYHALEYILETKDIAVVIEAEHFCVKSRGVEDVNSSTITSRLGGKFLKNNALREEFMSLIK